MCSRFGEGLVCPHVRQAKIFQRMRRARDEEDTIELELDAGQLETLSQALIAQQADSEVSAAVAVQNARPHSSWKAVIVAAAVAVVWSGIVWLVASQADHDGDIEQTPVEAMGADLSETARLPQSPPVQSPPVRFANPFDESEVFEFPPGTSDEEARAAVAAFLLERARNRLDASTDRPQFAREAAQHERPSPAVSLAHRY